MKSTFILSPVASLALLICLSLGPVQHCLSDELPPLRVGVTPNAPPMIYKEGGKIVGVEADFAKVLGEELGRPIKFIEVEWDDQIPALTEGRTDIIMSSMSITRPRSFRVAFSRPYLAVGQMALVRRTDAAQYIFGFPMRLPGPVGLKRGTTGDFLVQQEYPSAKRKYFASGEQAAKALAKKNIDLFISDSPMIYWLEGMNEEVGLVAVPMALSEEQLAWGVRQSDTALLESVNQALDKMQKSGRLTAILKRWIPQLK